jgi:hypothetical protein
MVDGLYAQEEYIEEELQEERPSWVYFTSLEGDFLYYDEANIKRPYEMHNVIKVREKRVYKRITVIKVAELRGKRYGDLAESIKEYEIFCPKRQSLMRSVAFYKKNGEVIERREYPQANDWRTIPEDTPVERLYELLCFREREE